MRRLQSVHTCESVGIEEGMTAKSTYGQRRGIVTKATSKTFEVLWEGSDKPNRYVLTGVNPGCLRTIAFEKPQATAEVSGQPDFTEPF